MQSSTQTVMTAAVAVAAPLMFATPYEQTIEVRAEHIALGIQKDCTACAVALAVHEAFGLHEDAYVRVGFSGFAIYGRVREYEIGNDPIIRYDLPAEVAPFIDQFDGRLGTQAALTCRPFAFVARKNFLHLH